MLRFHRFRMPVAAVRPSELTLFLFFSSYTHGRYALIGRFSYRALPVTLASRDPGFSVSRATGSLTSMFPVFRFT